MSQYPVNSMADVMAAANYAISGPASTGQNTAEFKSYTLARLRPNGQAPYVVALPTTLNTNIYTFLGISNITITALDLITVTFTTPQATAPFQFGDIMVVDGVTPSDYDDSYTVFSCTTTEVVLQLVTGTTATLPAYVSGGDVGRNFENFNMITDCNGLVTVTGPQDRVMISAQAEITISYGDPIPSPPYPGPDYELDIVVQLLRFIEQPPSSPYLYVQSGVVDQRIYHITDSLTSNTATVEAVFSPVVDGPNLPIGRYYYVLAVAFCNKPDTDKSGYQTGVGGLLDNDFFGSGTINQSVVPGTTFSGISPAITGTGTSCTLDITLGTYDPSTGLYDLPLDPANPNYNVNTRANYLNTDVYVVGDTADFSVGDVLTVPGTSLGGTSPANDLTLTVDRIIYPGNITFFDCDLGHRNITVAVLKQ